MKTKTIMAVSAALSLTACVSAIAWKSIIMGADLESAALPLAADSTSNTYQLFPVGTQLYLRKVDPKGVEVWQLNVDASVADSLTFSNPLLRVTPLGVAVGYHDTASKQAFLKQYDANGTVLWSTDFGTHASEKLQDMALGADGSLTTATRITFSKAAIQRYDSSGLAGPETTVQRPFGSCLFGCVATIAVNATGETLVNLGDLLATSSYLLDANGTQLWSKIKSTNDPLVGATSNRITATATGFVSTHPVVTWHYDLNGTESWSQPYGSAAKPAIDASGNLYVLDSKYTSNVFAPIAPLIHKLASDGSLIWETSLTNQIQGKQLEWRDDLQRLVVLTHSNTGTLDFIQRTGPDELGYTLHVLDAAGTKMSSFKGVVIKRITELVTEPCPLAEGEVPTDPPKMCPRLVTTVTSPGEIWHHIAISPNKRVMVSGQILGSEQFAKAYKLQ